MRETIDVEDPAAHCPVWKWVDAGWRERERKPTLPPITTQAANAGKALLRAGTALIRRQHVRASEAAVAERLEICAACPQLVNGRCAKCGCFYKAKVRLATEQCPLGKWPAPL